MLAGGVGAELELPEWFAAAAAPASDGPDPRLVPSQPDREAPALVEVEPVLEADDSGFELVDADTKPDTAGAEHADTVAAAGLTPGPDLPEKAPPNEPSSSYQPEAGSALDMLQGLLGSAEADLAEAGPPHRDRTYAATASDQRKSFCN